MDSLPQLQMIEKIEPAGLQFPFEIPCYGIIQSQASWEIFCEYMRYLAHSYQSLKRVSSMVDDISWIQEREQDEAYERG